MHLPNNPLLAEVEPKRSKGKQLASLIKGATTTHRTRTKHVLAAAARVDAAIEQIETLPADGETLHAIMNGTYHNWDLIPAMIALGGCGIDKLTITTLGFNLRQAHAMAGLLAAGEIRTADFVCSHMYWQKERATCAVVEEELRTHGGRFAVCQNHSKVVLAAMTDGRHFVSESSANMRSCNAIEQFALTQSAELYEWHAQWIEIMLTTTNKKLRHNHQPPKPLKLG